MNDAILSQLDAIEAEMRRIGYWTFCQTPVRMIEPHSPRKARSGLLV